MIGALSLKGIIAAMTFKGGNDQLAFKTYVNEVLVPNLWSGASTATLCLYSRLQVDRVHSSQYIHRSDETLLH